MCVAVSIILLVLIFLYHPVWLPATPVISLFFVVTATLYFGVTAGLVAAVLALAYSFAALARIGSQNSELIIEILELAIAGPASVFLTARCRTARCRGHAPLRGERRKEEKLPDQFRFLFEADIIGYFILDFQGKIRAATQPFLATLGYDNEMTADLGWDSITPSEYHAVDRAKFAELEATGHCVPWRRELIARNGIRIPVVIGMFPLAGATDLAGAVAVNVSDMQSSERDLQKLAGRLLNLYDDERRNIARELHDTTAQNLAALSMNLTMLASVLEDPVRARKILEECSAVTEECLREVRSLSYMLHPPLLDELGLESAIRAFIDLYKRRTGVSVEFTCDNFGRLRREEELAAFRIAQEGLFNVHRHSGSARAEVRLTRRDTWLDVTVRDWGKGIDADIAVSSTSLGIAGMRERARLLGGKLDVVNADPGTLVRAEIHVE